MKPFYTDWDEFKDAQLCSAWVATAVIGAGVLGAGATIYASGKAKDAQTSAAAQAAAIAKQQYEQTRTDLTPYRDIGGVASKELTDQLPYLTSPIELTQDWLESTPGYEFTKTQGLKAVANSAAARGLGVSGAALKGAANFATGLADTTYKTQFDVENTNRGNAYARLKGLVDVGENAGAMTGVLGEKAAYNEAQASIGAGNAVAAADNAQGGAVRKLGNDISGYAVYKGLYGNNGTPTYTPTPAEQTTAGAFSQGL